MISLIIFETYIIDFLLNLFHLTIILKLQTLLMDAQPAISQHWYR